MYVDKCRQDAYHYKRGKACLWDKSGSQTVATFSDRYAIFKLRNVCCPCAATLG